MKHATISTICWNNLEHTKNFLKSLSVIKFPFDLFIWDNDSKDGTKEYLKILALDLPLCKIYKYVLNSENEGMPCAWNAALKYAFDENNHDLCFCCNNDIMFTNTINAIVPFIEKSVNVGMVSPKEIGRETDISKLEETAKSLVKEGSNDGLTGPCMIFTRETYKKVGLFDPQFQFSFEDCDMYERCKKEGLRNLVYHGSIIYHFGGASTSKKDIGSISEGTQPYYKLFQKKWGS